MLNPEIELTLLLLPAKARVSRFALRADVPQATSHCGIACTARRAAGPPADLEGARHRHKSTLDPWRLASSACIPRPTLPVGSARRSSPRHSPLHHKSCTC